MDSRYDAGTELVTEQVAEQVTEPAEVLRNSNGQFVKGQSGNPSGKKKATQEELDALEEIRKLAPGVAAKMTELLNAPKVPAIAKVRILEIILERTYGKPETALKLTTAQQSVEAAQARIAAIVSHIRIGDVMDDDR